MEQARVYRVLIASPGDVAKEREAAKGIIEEWNDRNSLARSIVLLPIMWERHLPDDASKMPQPLINELLVDNCDICIGIFWSRVGTPTPVAPGGAVEEVNRMLQAKKQVMLYFCTRETPKKADRKQVMRLKQLEQQYRHDRATGSYRTNSELVSKIRSSLDHHVNALEAAPSSSYSGDWLQIKDFKHKTKRPFALVDIRKDGREYKVAGCSYSADGIAGISWPTKKLDVNIQQRNMLIHCFEAKHNQSTATGVSCYKFPRETGTRPIDGHGFYSQQAQGKGLTSKKVDFALRRVTTGLVRFHLGRDWDKTEEEDLHQFFRGIYKECLYRRIAISGGPYSGKTSIVNQLRRNGMATTSEAAFEVIGDLKQAFGKEYSAWRKANFLEFQTRIFARQRALDKQVPSKGSPLKPKDLFMDRSAVDCIAYLEHHGISPPTDLIEYAEELPLKAVFILDTIKPFDMRAKSGREANYSESRRIRDRLFNVYTRMGFAPRFVDIASVNARIRGIREILENET